MQMLPIIAAPPENDYTVAYILPKLPIYRK